MYATPDAAAGPQSSEFFRRTLIVLSSASLLISLVVYFLHEWYHTDLVEFLGISHRMADTLGTLGILLVFAVAQRIISAIYFKDAYLACANRLTIPARAARRTRPANALAYPDSRKSGRSVPSS